MKDTSEPTGSPAPVIQHSSLAPSPLVGQNGLSSRAAAEAMAMSVLAGMGQQQRAESGPSHIIMAAQSQSAARWWAMPPTPEVAHTRYPGVKKSRGPPPTPITPTPPPSTSPIWKSKLLIYPFPLGRCSPALSDPPVEPSCCGLELSSRLLGMDRDFFERASCSLCHRLQGLDSNL